MTRSVLLQGLTAGNHLSAVNNVLGIPDPERVLLSVAFMTDRGLSALRNALVPVADKTTLVTGIRNGITSAQGLNRGLELGCSIFAVDTGARSVVFHPKIYLSRNTSEARLIVGSANLTIGGLSANVEASVLMTLDLDKPDDVEMVQRLEDQIDRMVAEYPQNVFRVDDRQVIEDLLVSGRVIDESNVAAPSASGSSGNRDLDVVPRMIVNTSPITRPRVQPFEASAPQEPDPGVTAAAAVVAPRERLTLVWTSNPLKRRHLTIPTGSTTHQTGSMLFGKGALSDIDQRHYFRDEVFVDIEWTRDANPRWHHLERGEAEFRFIVKDVEYPSFRLRLTHNTRTDTPGYQQRNSMTQVHWGEARSIIAREDLLERTMYLYRDELDTGSFVIQID
jgi:HKD family nuclease